MRTIRLGVVGVGAMGQNHVRACSELPSVELVGVFDPNAELAKQVSEKYKINNFQTIFELFKSVDAVTIAAPSTAHYDIAKQAIVAGKHMLVEKPLCLDFKQAEELCKLAENNKLTLAVGHIERHNPAVRFVKEFLYNGFAGAVLSLSAKRVGSIVGNRIRDVGVIYDLGIHEIDIGRYITNSEITSVSATGGAHTHEFEDYVLLNFAFESGACATTEINWLTPMKIRKLDITCANNMITLDYISQCVKILSAQLKDVDFSNLSYVPWEYNERMVSLRKQEPLKLEIQDFVEAVNLKHPPLVSGLDGAAAVKVAQAAVLSYKEKRVVNVREL